ncbi:hypothetical protein A2U01_0097994 [Trifolium medium]|nr:hypothetical protein [Trifolium medium]
MCTKWNIEGLSGDNLELWKMKMKAILMFEMMDKIWSVVIRCLEDKKVNGDCEEEHQPGEAVVRILDISLERRC